jgi:hypothetical protein
MTNKAENPWETGVKMRAHAHKAARKTHSVSPEKWLAASYFLYRVMHGIAPTVFLRRATYDGADQKKGMHGIPNNSYAGTLNEPSPIGG